MLFIRKNEYEVETSKKEEKKSGFLNFIILFNVIFVLVYFTGGITFTFLLVLGLFTGSIYMFFVKYRLYHGFFLFFRLFFLSDYNIVQKHPFFYVLDRKIIQKYKYIKKAPTKVKEDKKVKTKKTTQKEKDNPLK